jgi:hypothetical protein
MEQQEDNSEYPVYFTREEIMKHANSLSDNDNKLDYLLFALNEVRAKHEELVSLPEYQGTNYVAIQDEVRQLEGLSNQLSGDIDTLREREDIKISKNTLTAKIQNQIMPILWRKDNTQLCYLFELLKGKGFIATDDLAKLISEHFLDKKGNPFKVKQLNDAIYNTKWQSKLGKCRNSEVLEDIVEKIDS